MAIKLSKKKNQIKKVIKKANVVAKSRLTGKAGEAVKLPSGKFFEAIGRRKTATARVRVYPVKGDFVVNGLAVGKYFDEVVGAPIIYNQVLKTANLLGELTISVKVNGSGIRSQLDALILGLSRALVKYDPELRALLKPEGFLSRDDRMKETRKIGRGGKARRKRQSPKR